MWTTGLILVESDLNRDLRMTEQEIAITATPTDGLIMLPSDFLEIRKVKLLNPPGRELRYLTPSAYDRLGTVSGTPLYYTLTGTEVSNGLVTSR